jgi:hypothetical protein
VTFNTTVATPLPALVFVGLVLVAVGWATATRWQTVRLKRLRARNLRIVADLRRLTNWAAPPVRREPGNWGTQAWPPRNTRRAPERGASRRGKRPKAERRPTLAGQGEAPRAGMAVTTSSRPSAPDRWAEVATGTSSTRGAPQGHAGAAPARRWMPRRLVAALRSAIATARMVPTLPFAAYRLWAYRPRPDRSADVVSEPST